MGFSFEKHQWKGHQEVMTTITAKVVDCITSHNHVINSPIYNATLLIKDPEMSEKTSCKAVVGDTSCLFESFTTI
jgi:hypothetical protein